MRFNARYGCNTCEQKTKKSNQPIEVRNNNNEIVLRRKRVFLFQETMAPLRKGRRMDLQGELAERRKKSRKGVLGPAVVSKIPLFDRAKCICAEYLHLVALGVVKSLLTLFFFTPGPWYIGDKVAEMDKFMSAISVPDFVKRLPRGISQFKHWKGSEFRNFLLFYSCPVFKDRLPDDYFQHWLLLVQAMYILLQERISHTELKSAELMLRSFVRDYKKLYGENTYTYNLHTLLHVCTLVKRWGPMWATSAFIFENFNGFISAHLHGTKHLAKELINNIRIAMGVTLLDNIVNGHPVFRSRTQTTKALSYPFEVQKLTNEEKFVINSANFGRFLLYDRVQIRGEIYTAKPYDNGKKRGNSYVQLEGEQANTIYGQVSVFIKAGNEQKFALVNVLKMDHVNVFIHTEGRFVIKNLKPFKYTENLITVPVESIKTKVLKIGMYLGIRPNTVEVNL
ncbi:hypothetical protein ONE63_011471 [Megalurothrips usitatus]|uniref:Transposase domain-containing protein n=1 Tax=Megalurothrips usitatus TaxID=439358 RepID=A0AAV7WZ81_9NEOP|nr:hypothetical protein ONE63_011471 [Megalurothrips usitatus]